MVYLKLLRNKQESQIIYPNLPHKQVGYVINISIILLKKKM